MPSPSEALEQLRSKKSNGLLSHREVLNLVPLSRIEIYRRIRKGTFPAPLQLGKRAIAWKFGDIQTWIQNLETVKYAPKAKAGAVE